MSYPRHLHRPCPAARALFAAFLLLFVIGTNAHADESAPMTSRETPAASATAKWRWKRKIIPDAYRGALANDSAGHPHVATVTGDTGGSVEHSWFDGKRWYRETISSTRGEGVAGGRNHAIAVDSAGRIHVAWADSKGAVRYSRKTGQTWATGTVDAGTNDNVDPEKVNYSDIALTVDDSNTPYLLYVGSAGGQWVARMVGGAWTSEQVSATTSGEGSSLVVRNGNIFASFNAGGNIVMATNRSGAWESTIIGPGHRSSIAVDTSDRIHVAYERDGALLHAVLDGETWVSEELVTGTSAFGKDIPEEFAVTAGEPAITADEEGAVHLAFGYSIETGSLDKSIPVYAILDEGTWKTHPIDIPDTGSANAIAVDSRGIVGLLTLEVEEGITTLLYLGLEGKPLTMAVRPRNGGTITPSSGSACAGTCTQKYAPGTTVVLSAHPAGGTRFAGWSGACRGTAGTCTVAMDAARKVTAIFR